MQKGVASLVRIVSAICTDREHGGGVSKSCLGRIVPCLNAVEIGQHLWPRPGIERQPSATLKLWGWQ
jgi:hypothetical protein